MACASCATSCGVPGGGPFGPGAWAQAATKPNARKDKIRRARGAIMADTLKPLVARCASPPRRACRDCERAPHGDVTQTGQGALTMTGRRALLFGKEWPSYWAYRNVFQCLHLKTVTLRRCYSAGSFFVRGSAPDPKTDDCKKQRRRCQSHHPFSERFFRQCPHLLSLRKVTAKPEVSYNYIYFLNLLVAKPPSPRLS